MGVIVLNVGFCSSASADFPGLCPPALGSAPGRVARARGASAPSGLGRRFRSLTRLLWGAAAGALLPGPALTRGERAPGPCAPVAGEGGPARRARIGHTPQTPGPQVPAGTRAPSRAAGRRWRGKHPRKAPGRTRGPEPPGRISKRLKDIMALTLRGVVASRSRTSV